MLRFVLGKNSSGRTEYVRHYIAEHLKNGEKNFILLVPEQFSFDTERAMLQAVGARHMLDLEIFSFTRLAQTVLSLYKPQLKPKIDDGTRAVLMSKALEGLQEEAQLYAKFADKPQLLSSLVSFSTELKQCAVTGDALQKAGAQLAPCVLKEKLEELTKITDLYDALVRAHFADDTDLLDRLAQVICETDCFDGKTVILDAFDGFTKQERNVIARMLTRCKDIFVTLCLERDIVHTTPCVFDNIYAEYETLKRLAAQEGVQIAAPVYLPNTDLQKPGALRHLEENLYKPVARAYDAPEDEPLPLQIFSASNPADECEFVARSIHRLLREGTCQAKDIAVLERRKNTYGADLCAAFQKYHLPFFEDKRQPIEQQPLMRYVTALLNIAAEGISTERVFQLLKTDLTALEPQEIAALEKYTTIWSIDRTAWFQPFTGNPAGLGVAMHERSQKELQKINALREKAAAPIERFLQSFRPLNGIRKSELLFQFLKQNHVDLRLKALAEDLEKSGFAELAEQQNTVWEILMHFLDSLAQVIGEESVTAKRYRDDFAILLDCVDLGQIPQGLDMITVGAIDRIRIAPPQVLFIMGANDGVFPENPPTDGILNDRERKSLEALGVALTETAEFKVMDERYFVYAALSLASQQIFISYSSADFKGKSMTESELVREVRRCIPSVPTLDSNTTPYEAYVECPDAAFETMALLYHQNTPLSAALKTYFQNEPAYASRAHAVARAAEREVMHFETPSAAEKLFGKDMMISASKAEVYYKCPFSYFCKFGLQIRVPKKAEIDFAQSGTMMHYALEMLLKTYSMETLAAFSKAEMQEKIHAVIETYIEENMGGRADKDARFLYLLSDLSKTIQDVLERLLEESKVSSFVPADFELAIAPDASVSPYKLDLQSGGSLQVIGSVDRVDRMEREDKTYFRIIDYKSGGKAFRLSDVFGGLNMQMLIYLFAIAQNGTEHYAKAIPAGVLYMPAKTAADGLERSAKAEDVLESKLKNTRMDGVILENTDVILGMDREVSGRFINVQQSGNGFKGALLNAKAFSLLKERVDGNLISMAEHLQAGCIPVQPTVIGKTNAACKYCDFRSVCGYEDGDAVRTLENSSSFAKAKEKLTGEGNE